MEKVKEPINWLVPFSLFMTINALFLRKIDVKEHIQIDLLSDVTYFLFVG